MAADCVQNQAMVSKRKIGLIITGALVSFVFAMAGANKLTPALNADMHNALVEASKGW